MFKKDPADVRLKALAIERSPDILAGAGKLLMGMAVVIAALMGAGALAVVARIAKVWL